MDISMRGLSEQLNADMAYLKAFLQVEKDTGFTDAAKVIELLSVELFRAAKIADFTNVNLIQMNFPSIDLHEPKPNGLGIAAQVTSTASISKINKTIKAFSDPRPTGALTSKYSKLYILGLLTAAKKPITAPSYCEVLSFNDLVQLIISHNDPDLMYDAIHAIRTHQHRSMLLVPSQDNQALMIVLGFLNRSAVKHDMQREGSVPAMVKGLKELKEVITQGSVRGKSITKRAGEYADPDIANFLHNVGNLIDQITGTVNGATNGGYILTSAEAQHIDQMKSKLVREANTISAARKLNFTIAMI